MINKSNNQKITSKVILTILFLITSISIAFPNNDNKIYLKKFNIEVPKEKKAVDEWSIFIEAVIWKESRGKENAIGDNGRAVGVLQLHKIMVDETNRISKITKNGKYFTYNDRYNRDKSIEMFNIVQGYHNKEKNREKALKIWNSGHPKSYKIDILNKYNELLEQEECSLC